MVMTAEGVADQYGVAGIAVQFAVGFVHQLVVIEGLPAIESHGGVEGLCLGVTIPTESLGRVSGMGVGLS